jgi:hypothetical protein
VAKKMSSKRLIYAVAVCRVLCHAVSAAVEVTSSGRNDARSDALQER